MFNKPCKAALQEYKQKIKVKNGEKLYCELEKSQEIIAFIIFLLCFFSEKEKIYCRKI